MATIISNMSTARLTAPRLATSKIKTLAESNARRPTRLPQLWLQRLFWRAELKALDAGQLRDCGLDPVAVAREAMKPFWRD
jgi:uncharacterized protein YjiS (DUF1127 family)